MRRARSDEPYLWTGRSMIMAGHADQKLVAHPICPEATGRGRSLINWVAELRVGGDKAPIPRDWNRRADKQDFAPAFKEWRFGWLDVPALIEGAEAVYVETIASRYKAIAGFDRDRLNALSGEPDETRFPQQQQTHAGSA